MRIETVTLTPAKAAEWFGTVAPEKQRRFRDHHAVKLAEIIKRGEWRQNNDMFMFDANGCLANGQHRAAAIAKAGRTVSVVVAHDCTDEQIKVADQGGLPRRNEDALRYAGFDNTTNLAAIINTIKRDVENERFAPSAFEVVTFAKTHYDALVESLGYWRKCAASRCPVEPSIVAAVWFVAQQVDKRSADSFTTALSDGVPGDRGDAIWMLLRRFKEDKERFTGRMTRHVRVALVIKAYQFWKANKRPPFIRWSPGQGEEFPVIK
jgi:hypothetical protein